MLIVRLSTLGLNVLLNGVDLRLVFDQLLLDVVQPVVDVTCKDRVLLGVVLDRMVSDLLGQPILVDLQKVSDVRKSHLLMVKLSLHIVGLREFILDIVVHLLDFFLGLDHFLFNSEFERFNFLKILVDVFLLNLKLSCGGGGVVKLPLLECKILLHVIDLERCW